MEPSSEIKILICNSDKKNSIYLQQILNENKAQYIVIETDQENCKWMQKAYQPSLIITDLNPFNNESLLKLRIDNNIPLIIWTEEANQKIMSAVFNMQNISFVKKSENKKILLDAINKSIIIIQ